MKDMTRNNEMLKELYNKVYSGGKEKFFTTDSLEITAAVLEEDDWKDKTVFEAGCGTGETAYGIAMKGGKVLACDYSEEAIKIAKEKFQHPNLSFVCRSYNYDHGKYDVVVMQETMEHTNDPVETLKKLKGLVKDNGKIIVTCPSFLNIRGYIWMSLLILFNVPMSLSDVQYICPFNMEEWGKELGLKVKWKTIRHDVGNGKLMVTDLTKRLTNALRDAKMPNENVPKLIEWLDKASKYDNNLPHTGATGVYVFTKA